MLRRGMHTLRNIGCGQAFFAVLFDCSAVIPDSPLSPHMDVGAASGVMAKLESMRDTCSDSASTRVLFMALDGHDCRYARRHSARPLRAPTYRRHPPL